MQLGSKSIYVNVLLVNLIHEFMILSITCDESRHKRVSARSALLIVSEEGHISPPRPSISADWQEDVRDEERPVTYNYKLRILAPKAGRRTAEEGRGPLTRRPRSP
jgi:hypothetical protein